MDTLKSGGQEADSDGGKVKVLEREGLGVSVGLVDVEMGWLGGGGRKRRR